MTTEHTTTAIREHSYRGISPAAERILARVAGWLSRHSIDILRMSVGLVFLGFGALKFIPDLSPAEGLAVRTLETMSFGILSGQLALLTTAVAECFVGLTLLTGRLLKVGLLMLAASLVGIMSPLVLFFTDMFSSGPTLEAQYILKDVVLIASGLVITARALGARMVPAEVPAQGAHHGYGDDD